MMKLKKSVMFEFALSGAVGWKIQEEEQNVRRGPWGDVEVTKDRSLLHAVECQIEDIEMESLYNNSRELKKKQTLKEGCLVRDRFSKKKNRKSKRINMLLKSLSNFREILLLNSLYFWCKNVLWTGFISSNKIIIDKWKNLQICLAYRIWFRLLWTHIFWRPNWIVFGRKKKEIMKIFRFLYTKWCSNFLEEIYSSIIRLLDWTEYL